MLFVCGLVNVIGLGIRSIGNLWLHTCDIHIYVMYMNYYQGIYIYIICTDIYIHTYIHTYYIRFSALRFVQQRYVH